MSFLAPNLLQDRALAEQYTRYERQATGPGAAKAMIGRIYEMDVRHVLPAEALGHRSCQFGFIEGLSDPQRRAVFGRYRIKIVITG